MRHDGGKGKRIREKDGIGIVGGWGGEDECKAIRCDIACRRVGLDCMNDFGGIGRGLHMVCSACSLHAA